MSVPIELDVCYFTDKRMDGEGPVDVNFGYSFPAIRGIQANREYFASMCPLRLIPRIFLFDEDEAELSPQLRAQRTLNKNRVPELADYIVTNRGSYTFSAITASIDGDVTFQSMSDKATLHQLGVLHVPMDAKFIINDGQHRRAAIEAALQDEPELGDEHIAVVFFIDQGLQRCQQMFADLNRYAIRPSRSIGILYDHRDALAQISRLVVFKSDFFKNLVELERSSLSPRSRRLFTLSALHHATAALLEGRELEDVEQESDLALAYWEAVACQMPEWQLVKEGKVSSGEVRQDFIHCHAIALQALGHLGNALLKKYPKRWKEKLEPLSKIDWSRANTELWEGRAMIGGRLNKSSQTVQLTTNALKSAVGLELSAAEGKAEKAMQECA